MSVTRHLRALTTSCRALSARTVVQHSARSAVAHTQPYLPKNLNCIHRSFSGSPAVRKGSKDSSLSHKLQEEIKYEQDAAEESTPEFLKAFQKETPWTIETSGGSDEVALARTFGKENIRVLFSIADIDAGSEDQFFNQGDESAAENEESAEESEDSEDETGPSYPIRTSITVSKPKDAPGSLSIDAVCQDGVFVIENIAYYSDSSLATELSAEADWKRRGLYMGPQFDHLDVSVQEEFDTFLRDRGITEGLALFIPEYAEYKEQKEYIRWLESVKTFIDA
ncbi:regulatory protein suaprga1 [Hysterangium stoloniferum]|nr:regulatory protein suaprga1 [Hysterangium stoloniferum]